TLLMGKHVLIGASLQYQLSGYNLRYQSETITDEFTVTQDIFHSQRYHKIAMPISLSFRFKVGSIHPFVGFGYRAAWINHVRFRGYYQTASPDSAGLNRHLPYDIGNFHPSQRAARQWVPQVMFTLGAEIGERLTVTLHAAAGSFGIPTPMNYYDQFRTYRNRELYATLAWRIW
ncbi:MAG TPA: hypothetical protein VHS96_14870, partial [Bacteroidia bacterium]|nr:hypothetical protein [Bacteroidia bacterium]